jgi:hypothetical protein
MKRSPLHSRMLLILTAALAWTMFSSIAAAQNYSVKINSTLNGLDVRFDPVANPEMLIVIVSNRSDRKVRCDFVYEAGPQFPFRTAAFVDPGKDTQSVFRATTYWFSVDVNVTCIAV